MFHDAGSSVLPLRHRDRGGAYPGAIGQRSKYSLEEIADLVDSTVGGVKAALNRGRSKLAKHSRVRATPIRTAENAETNRLLGLYVERFNRRDWDGVRELIVADATVRIPDRFAGRLSGSPYFGRYDRLTSPWRAAVGSVDGEPVVITLREVPGGWTPEGIVRVERSDGHIVRIVDYTHCPWVLSTASSVVVSV